MTPQQRRRRIRFLERKCQELWDRSGLRRIDHPDGSHDWRYGPGGEAMERQRQTYARELASLREETDRVPS